jgi:hypothetical protein
MSGRVNFILRLFFVLIIIIGATSVQFWAPSVLGINLLVLSIKSLVLISTAMTVIIFLILGRPIHFLRIVLKSK